MLYVDRVEKAKRIIERVCPICDKRVYFAKLHKGESASWVSYFADQMLINHRLKEHSEVQ